MNMGSSTSAVEAGLELALPLFGPEVELAAADPTSDQFELFPEEAAALTRAVDKRRREFAAGRAAARAAMARLGVGMPAIPQGSDRAPVWPEGITGTISHCNSLCLAAVSRRSDFAGLGIDVEEDKPLAMDLVKVICTPRERVWLERRKDDGRLAKLIFSAKECAYKCQYPVSGVVFGFDTLRIHLEPGQFEAEFLADVRGFPRGTRLQGRYAAANGLIVTAMALPA